MIDIDRLLSLSINTTDRSISVSINVYLLIKSENFAICCKYFVKFVISLYNFSFFNQLLFFKNTSCGWRDLNHEPCSF